MAGNAPCCGEGAVIYNLELSRRDLAVELVSADNPEEAGHVDAFLTSGDCPKLFDTYTGHADAPLCPIYIGPVAEGSASGRHALPRGIYRVFAQPWGSSASLKSYNIDVGVWVKSSCVTINP